MEDPGSPQIGEASESPPTLDRRLAGSLPCIECGYELQGMSVRGHCPECGLAVRATILYVVDPHAEAFQPMRHPRLVGGALVAATLAGVIGALCVWLLRLSDAITQGGGRGGLHEALRWGPAGASAVAGVCVALFLVHPVKTGPVWRPALAALAAALFVPLTWLLHRLHVMYDPAHFTPYFDVDAQPTRIGYRLAIGVSLLAILLLFRPTGRHLVARSLVLRTGRVDRQTLIATASALVLTMVGDLLRLGALHVGPQVSPLLAAVGTVVVAVGSLLVTLGLIGALIDCWRINLAISRPPPSLREVLGGAGEPPRTVGGTSPAEAGGRRRGGTGKPSASEGE